MMATPCFANLFMIWYISNFAPTSIPRIALIYLVLLVYQEYHSAYEFVNILNGLWGSILFFVTFGSKNIYTFNKFLCPVLILMCILLRISVFLVLFLIQAIPQHSDFLYIRKKYACFPYGSRLQFPEIRTIMWQIHHFLIFEDGTPWSISYVVEQLHMPSQHLWPRRPLKSPDAPAWRP